MNLNPSAIALLVEVLDAETGRTFPVAYLRDGYLPEDVGGDVLYPRRHLALQRARARRDLAVGTLDAEGPSTSVSEWLVHAERLPDADDWRRFCVAPAPDGDPPIVGAEAAATVLRASRSAVDRRIRLLPPGVAARVDRVGEAQALVVGQPRRGPGVVVLLRSGITGEAGLGREGHAGHADAGRGCGCAGRACRDVGETRGVR